MDTLPLHSPAQLAAHLEITSPLVRNYFDNLLPDNPRIRERMRSRYRTRPGRPAVK